LALLSCENLALQLTRFVERAMSTVHSSETPVVAQLRGSVLYIEDEPTNFALVEALLLVHPDLHLLQAQTGDEGVGLARSKHPDAILLDMHLPDISGIEVVRRLSEDIAAGAFRVILLTADRLNIDVLKAMSLGAFEYLIKPVSLQALEAAVGRALAAKARNNPTH
jgi:CheY-like chemotaxis protein